MYCITLLAALLSVIPQICNASPTRQPLQVASKHKLLSANTTAYIDAARIKHGIKGVAVTVVLKPKNGEEDWISDYGLFGTANAVGDPVTEDTYFAIASNSKLFTALSIGILIENGTALANGELLSWTTSIKDVLPDWRLLDGYAEEHLTIEDLGSMRSGLPRHDQSYSAEMTVPEIIANMRYLKSSAEARQYWQYENIHYVLLSHIVTVLSKTPYPEWVKQHIFEPLGMSSSTYNATEAWTSGRSTDAYVRSGRDVLKCAQGWKGVHGHIDKACLGDVKSIGPWSERDFLTMAGAGGVATTARDLTAWLQELLDPKVIPSSAIQRAASPLTVPSRKASYPEISHQTYGLAQMIFSYRGHAMIEHGGSLAGQRSTIIRAPDDGFGIAVTVNDDEFGNQFAEVVRNVVIDQLLGSDGIDWDERIMGKLLGDVQKPTALPEHPRETPEEASFRGQYHNKGYGTINLQALHPNDTSHLHSTLLNSPPTGLNLSTIYYSPFPKIFATHIIFTPFDGPLFNWTVTALQEVRDSSGKTGEWVGQSFGNSGTAVWTDEGIGMFGDFWGKGGMVTEVEVSEVNVKERSEVWFERLK